MPSPTVTTSCSSETTTPLRRTVASAVSSPPRTCSADVNEGQAELGGAAQVVARPSERVDCEHAVECAGCPLIDLTYAEQLEAKRERVKSAAAPYLELSRLRIEPVAPAEPFTRYRIRAKLMVGRPGGGRKANVPSIGLF